MALMRATSRNPASFFAFAVLADLAVASDPAMAVQETALLSAVQAILDSVQDGNGEAFRSVAKQDLPKLEADLKPLVATLPSGPDVSRLGPTAVCYVLHRLFMRNSAWLVKGLNPQGMAWNKTSPSQAVLFTKMPKRIQQLVEEKLAGPGLDLSETAIVAALFRHFVHQEASEMLHKVYTLRGMPSDGGTGANESQIAVEMFASSFVMGRRPAVMTRSGMMSDLQSMPETYPAWPFVRARIRKVMKEQFEEAPTTSAAAQGPDFLAAARVAHEVTDRLGFWQQPACGGLKETLVKMEDRGTGRVRLASFYGKSLHEGTWQFSESESYLRQLGALDESNPNNPRVIIPNYMYGASNCIPTTEHISVCCASECEVITQQLEAVVACSEAPPETIAAVVTSLPSSTVPANRTLSALMLHRLNSIAASHNGVVPLHGRLFAQWLHHAYPRDCPYPHVAGTTHPQDTDDWMKNTGLDYTALAADMARHAGSDPRHWKQPGSASRPLESAPWSYEEELFVPGNGIGLPEGWMVLHGAVYAASAAIVAFGIMLLRTSRGARRSAAVALDIQASKLYQV